MKEYLIKFNVDYTMAALTYIEKEVYRVLQKAKKQQKLALMER
jgi:hypothetical protein